MVALAARIVSRSPSWLSDATPSKRRGTLHMEESVADSAGAPAPEAAPARVEVAVGAADILGVGGVAGVAGAADVAGLVGVASPASSSCAARSVSSAASWKACIHHARTMHTPCIHLHTPCIHHVCATHMPCIHHVCATHMPCIYRELEACSSSED